MIPDDVPAQLDAPSLAGCSICGTAHVGDSDRGLGHLQDMVVIVVTEQLEGLKEKGYQDWPPLNPPDT